MGPETPLKFESGTPGPLSEFKSGTSGPPSKFKSGILIIIFLHCLTYYVLDKYIIWKWFSTNILSYILCSGFIHHFREILNVTLGVCNATEGSFLFGDRGKDPCNLSGVQLARQFMKLNSSTYLTHYLPGNLKIWHKFSPTTYTNQEFWFHLCDIHSLCHYNSLNKIMCFVLVNSTGFCWLCMRNSLADNVIFVLMEFRNVQ